MGAKMSKTTNALNWFEIPVTDMPRAQKFYEAIFDIQMTIVEMPGAKMCFFPPDGSNSSVGGALVEGPNHKPNASGCIIYLNANPDLQLVLDRVIKLGGKVTVPKMNIGENHGFMAFFMDTEGNTVGLHSNE